MVRSSLLAERRNTRTPLPGRSSLSPLAVKNTKKGFDSACLAMFIATGRNLSVTLAVFSKWAAQTGLFMFNEREADPPRDKVSLVPPCCPATPRRYGPPRGLRPVQIWRAAFVVP